MGAIIRNEESMHGRVVELIRGGQKTKGVIVAKDMKNHPGEYSFRWTDKEGQTCINDVSEEELKALKISMKPKEELPKKLRE